MKSKIIKPIHVVVLGLAISIGPGLGGFFIGKAIDRFKASEKSVTVKGLSERVVDADKSQILITMHEKTDDIAMAAKMLQDELIIVKKMLVDSGFKIENIKDSIHIHEESIPYQEHQIPFYKKYNYEIRLKIDGYDKEAIEKFNNDLLKIRITGKMLNVSASETHTFTKLEEIRAPMLAEATKSARAMADQFAKDSGTHVGGILKASQGSFSITGEKDTSGSEHYSHDTPASIKKRVRVVSNITFRLE